MADAALKFKKLCVQLKSDTNNVADFKERLKLFLEMNFVNNSFKFVLFLTILL